MLGFGIMEFLRDYITIFPAIIAVMNGVLAVLMTHYPFETPSAKLAFIIIIVSLSAAAIGATFYSQHLIVAERHAQTAKKTRIREQLGELIEEGNAIKRRCEDSALPVPLADANKWKGRTEAFLETELGHSYVILFRDRTGIFQSEIQMHGDDTHINMWSALYCFIFRLHEFSQQLPI
jgi:hypothetical protein